MMNKKLKKQKGITLIALVITIIVMLILVAVTINMAINGELFDYAGKAVGETQNAIDEEGQLSDGRIQVDGIWYDSINAYLEGEISLEQEGREIFSEIYNENTPITQGEYTAVIPKGFAVGISEGINTIEEGLVIQDKEGNEFVWVPVTFSITEGSTKDENGLYPEFLAVFYRSYWSNNARTTGLSADYTEPYEDGYEGESADYYEMMKSVQNNGGFYIGRYEAGSQDESGNPIARTNIANGTSKVVVQRDQYPYIYVGWGLTMSDYTSDVTYSSKNQGKGALYLSKHMYDGKDVGVTSTLCYGVQWDAMLDFIKDDTHNVTNSGSWGNHYHSTWTITRTTAKYTTNPSSDSTWTTVTGEGKTKTSGNILLTTGASDNFVAKNIYDVAGNVDEWTNEVNSSGSYRVTRGDCYGYHGNNGSINIRCADNPYRCYENFGFRPALYIK